MNYSLYLQNSAVQDIKDSYQWYEEKLPGLGDRFLVEVDVSLVQIELNPNIFPAVFMQKRRAVVKKFPYIIVFEIEEELIRVSAIIHTSRNPKSWKRRK